MSLTTTDEQLKKMAIKIGCRLDDVMYLKEFISDPKIGNYILNLDSENRGGTHWIAVINLPDKLFYFDPFGRLVNKNQLEKLLKKKIYYSNIKLQNIKETNCGYWCLIFLTEAEDVKTESEFNNALEELKFYTIRDPAKKK